MMARGLGRPRALFLKRQKAMNWHFFANEKTGGVSRATVTGGYLFAYPDGRWTVELDGKLIAQGECTAAPFLESAQDAAVAAYERETGLNRVK